MLGGTQPQIEEKPFAKRFNVTQPTVPVIREPQQAVSKRALSKQAKQAAARRHRVGQGKRRS